MRRKLNEQNLIPTHQPESRPMSSLNGRSMTAVSSLTAFYHVSLCSFCFQVAAEVWIIEEQKVKVKHVTCSTALIFGMIKSKCSFLFFFLANRWPRWQSLTFVKLKKKRLIMQQYLVYRAVIKWCILYFNHYSTDCLFLPETWGRLRSSGVVCRGVSVRLTWQFQSIIAVNSLCLTGPGSQEEQRQREPATTTVGRSSRAKSLSGIKLNYTFSAKKTTKKPTLTLTHHILSCSDECLQCWWLL